MSPMPEPLESRNEMLIEDGHLTIEGQSGFWERTDDLGEFTKSPRVIPPVPADEVDLPVTLASQNPPPIIFLLEDPSLPMERTGGESGVHEVEGETHTSSISPRYPRVWHRTSMAMEPLSIEQAIQKSPHLWYRSS